MKKYFIGSLFLLIFNSCADKDALLGESLSEPMLLSSGDIIIVSGGTVASTATPYPMHKIALFSRDGEFKRMLKEASSTERYFGAALANDYSGFYFTIDTYDRVEFYDFNTDTSSVYLYDTTLAGNTMRAMALLSDNSIVVAESTTSIEKFDADNNRVTANFPFTLSANIQNIKRISGNRFVVLNSGGTDTPRVYDYNRNQVATISGLACGNNCDPYDIIELADGRFVVSYQIAAFNSLEIFDENFVHIGRLFQDINRLARPSSLAVIDDNTILACSEQFHNCEKLLITGNEAEIVGDVSFISNPNHARFATAILVVP